MAGEPVLYVVDVGHGNAAIFSCAGKVLVVDAGSGSTLLQALQDLKFSRVDFMLISHADADHIGGLQSVMEESSIEIGTVFANSDSVKDTKTWKDIVFELEDRKGTVLEPMLTPNDTKRLSVDNVVVEIVAPSPALAVIGPGGTDKKGRKLTANAMSVVVRFLLKGSPVVLLPGDLDDIGLQNAIERHADLHAPVVVFPHHGGHPGPNTDAEGFVACFLEQVQPDVVIFSIGRGKHDTPHPDIAGAIRKHTPNARICCTEISEHCIETTPTMAGAFHLSIAARGRERGHSCAGTLKINFGPPVTVLPSNALHDDFIRAHVPDALCKS